MKEKFKDRQQALEYVAELLFQAEQCLAQSAICESPMLRQEAFRLEKKARAIYESIQRKTK